MILNSCRPWKAAFALTAVLIIFTTYSNTGEAASSCSVNCLSVYSIALAGSSTSIKGTVRLIDDEGTAGGSRSATVHAVWTRPDGSELDQYALIGTRLRAEFSLYTAGAPGTYTLTVVDVTKSGYTFDPTSASKQSESISIGTAGNLAPTAVANANQVSGAVPLTVNFDSNGSSDLDGYITDYKWDFGDGSSSNEANPSHVYNDVGNFTAVLTVTDDMGVTAASSLSITAQGTSVGCVTNCMLVDQINMSFKKKTKAVKALVMSVDEYGNQVEDASVYAVWTLPDGSKIQQFGDTGTRSRANFTLNAESSGTYILTVVEMSKDGYVFDPESSNVLKGMINVGL